MRNVLHPDEVDPYLHERMKLADSDKVYKMTLSAHCLCSGHDTEINIGLLDVSWQLVSACHIQMGRLDPIAASLIFPWHSQSVACPPCLPLMLFLDRLVAKTSQTFAFLVHFAFFFHGTANNASMS